MTASDILTDYRRRLADICRVSVGGRPTKTDLRIIVKRTAQACRCSEDEVNRLIVEQLS